MSKGNVINEYTNKLKKYTDSLAQNPAVAKEVKVNCIIQATALTCAIVAAQPIPFADIFVLTPIQLVMIVSLNKVLGNPFEESSLKEILASLIGIVGWGTLAQHTILGLYKTVIPFMGAITTVPLVYAATFALGTGGKWLIEAKKNDQTISNDKMKKIMDEAKKEAIKNNKNLTVSEALKQIKTLFSSVDEYEKYKDDLMNIQEQIYSVYQEEIVIDTDVSKIISLRKKMIKERILKYEQIDCADYVISIFSIMNSADFIQVAERVISDLNYNFEQSQFLNSKKNKSSIFYELQTTIGVFFIIKNEKIRIINLELNDEYKNNSIFEYMNLSSSDKLLRDIEIRNEFHNVIRRAKKYIYIVSPWANLWVYNDICPLLKEQTEKYPNLDIRVLYGICDYSNNPQKKKKNLETLKDTKENIEKYKNVLGDNFLAKETNTHVKLLICDDEMYMLGSMNLLSFSGNYDKQNGEKLHHEVSIISDNVAMLTSLKEAYFDW